jgi:hypothetical protein
MMKKHVVCPKDLPSRSSEKTRSGMKSVLSSTERNENTYKIKVDFYNFCYRHTVSLTPQPGGHFGVVFFSIH